MAVKLKQREEAIVENINYTSNGDYKSITLLSDGKVYVEHKTLADALIKKGKAKEAKGVEFDVIPLTIKEIEEVRK